MNTTTILHIHAQTHGCKTNRNPLQIQDRVKHTAIAYAGSL